MSKLPTTTDSSDNRQLAMADKIARFRAATGRPERRVIARRCSKSLKDYLVIFERTDPTKKFTLSKIAKAEPRAEGNSTKSAAPAAQPAKDEAFDASEFEWKGVACPWCGSGGSVHHSDCATTYCSGAVVTRDGERLFTCPACHTTAGLVDAASVSGQAASLAARDDLKRIGRDKPRGLLKFIPDLPGNRRPPSR